MNARSRSSVPLEQTPLRQWPARPLGLLASALLLTACQEPPPESELAKARQEMQSGQSQAAAIRVRGVLAQNAKSAEARFLLGELMFRSGDSLSAEQELRTAGQLGIDAERLAPLLAQVMLDLGEHDKLLAEFEDIRLAGPVAMADLHVSRALARLSTKDLEGAAREIERARSLDPKGVRLLVAQAQLAGRGGQLSQALALVGQALERDPRSLEGLRARASFDAANGDIPGAIKSHQEVARIRPADINAHYRALNLLLKEGKVVEARAQLAAMKRAVPKHPVTSYAEALVAVRENRLREASEALARATSADPNDLAVLLLSGMVNAQIGNVGIAETHLRRVISLVPDNMAARRALVSVLIRTGRVDEALRVGEELVKQYPNRSESFAIAGTAYLQAGQARKATEHFEKAAAKSPGNPLTLTGLAVSHALAGAPAEALRDLEQAAAADGSGTRAESLMIRAYLADRKPEKALQVAQAVERKTPDQPDAYQATGQILLMMNRTEAARQKFEQALRSRGDYLPALQALARLDLRDAKPAAAKSRYEVAMKQHPGSASLRVAFAELLRATNASDNEVLQQLELGVKAGPTDPSARLALVAFHLQTGSPDAAIKAAQDAVSAMPTDVRLLEMLAELQVRKGMPAAALATLERALVSAPGSVRLHLRHADLQTASGAFAGAIRTLQKAWKLQPDNRDVAVRLVSLEQRANKPENALKSARELQARSPKDPLGYLLEGEVLLAQKQFEPAAKVLQSGLDKTRSPLVAVRLHQALTEQKATVAADRLEAEWTKTQGGDPLFRNYQAQRALARNDPAGAARFYQAVVRARPNDAQALNNLAWAAFLAKDPNALTYAQQANDASPNTPQIEDTLGWILVERGDLAAGLALLRKAFGASSEATNIRLHLAQALVRSGEKDEARKHLLALAKLGKAFPRQAEVARLLDAL